MIATVRVFYFFYRFVNKVRSLDPSHVDVPWKPRGYSRKRPRDTAAATSSAKQLCSPLVPEQDTEDTSETAPQQRTASHTCSHTHQSTTKFSSHSLSAPPTSILGLSYSSSSSEEEK